MTGGASDANTADTCDVAVLDGLGLAGGKEHHEGEYIEIASIAPRIALLAGLLRWLGEPEALGPERAAQLTHVARRKHDQAPARRSESTTSAVG